MEDPNVARIYNSLNALYEIIEKFTNRRLKDLVAIKTKGEEHRAFTESFSNLVNAAEVLEKLLIYRVNGNKNGEK